MDKEFGFDLIYSCLGRLEEMEKQEAEIMREIRNQIRKLRLAKGKQQRPGE